MMSFLTSNITNFGLIGVIVWQFIQQIRSGNSSLSTKMISDYKERNGQLEGILENERATSEAFKADMEQVVNGYKLEIARLKASNDEKDAHNQALKELLQDKNPEVIGVLKEIRDFLKTTDEQNKKVLTYQTEILEEWRDRSQKINEASKEHIGNVMRIPSEV